jgi:hypothetical protein
VKHRAPDYGAPPRFRELMLTLDPIDDYKDIRIGADLLAASGFTKAELREIEDWLVSFLADSQIVKADIKGLLNRNFGRIGVELSGRQLLEAVARELRNLV